MRRAILGLVLLSFLPAIVAAQDRKDEKRRQEEAENYYRKWLQEDVVYIVTEEEKGVFKSLTTPEEKEQFIEQFWFRRDPDPRTPGNEYKQEHYRRIAYANEHYASGLPGWMTDRGRIYIIHGPPAEIESHPSGGQYQRPIHEGGGSTATYPFEIWRYRHIEGVGSDIELEFVDPTNSNEYHLALVPEEKDALLYVPGAGLTRAEELGLATKADRPFFSGDSRREGYPYMFTRAKDNPFTRYETIVQMQAPAVVKYKDLKELVTVDVSFDDLPLRMRQDHFKLNDRQALVPVTIQLDNKDLSFRQEESGLHVSRVAVYGLVTSITNRVVFEFEDDLVTSLRPAELIEGLKARSVYQKVLTLDRKMRHKIDLVVKDLNSGAVGLLQKAIVPPRYADDKIAASSLILASLLRELDEVPEKDEMFVIGDVKVRPSLENRFRAEEGLGLYFQLYNIALDQATLEPSLAIAYRIHKDGEVVQETLEERGESVQFVSGRRIVIIKHLPLSRLEPGRYRLEVQVTDRINGSTIALEESLVIKDY